MLSLKNISYSYTGDNNILDDFSLDISSGEYIAVVGANGSGKSTLAKIMSGIITPDKGSVEINSKKDFPIGIVFQNPSNQLIRGIVEEDISFGLENMGIDTSKREIIIDEVLQALDIEDLKKEDIRFLSGGQKQKVAIAGVIAMSPDFVIFDESTSMLDPVGRDEIIDTMKILNDGGITVINITHHMEELKDVNRVIFMKDGSIAGEEKPSILHHKEELMNSCNLLQPLNLKLARLLEKKGYKVTCPWNIEEVLSLYEIRN